MWDISAGDAIHTISEHEDDVWAVAFSPDGTKLASGGGDTVSLWDVATAELLQTFRRPIEIEIPLDAPEELTGDVPTDLPANATSIVFSPDGKVLVSGSYDRTIRLWDIATGEQLRTLEGHTYSITSVAVSPNGTTIASGSFDGTVILWAFPLPISLEQVLAVLADVNNDGTLNILDLVLVASSFGVSGESPADLNNDGVVNLLDLYLISNALENVDAAPSGQSFSKDQLTAAQVQEWLTLARQVPSQISQNLKVDMLSYQRGIHVLEQILQNLTPNETTLFANYPNPFNPETWIPYNLATPAEVTLTIYAADGKVVRTLTLGHKSVGIYQSKSRAAYWDGKNEVGESVTSGIYFYTLSAGNFTATRKLLIRK